MRRVSEGEGRICQRVWPGRAGDPRERLRGAGGLTRGGRAPRGEAAGKQRARPGLEGRGAKRAEASDRDLQRRPRLLWLIERRPSLREGRERLSPRVVLVPGGDPDVRSVGPAVFAADRAARDRERGAPQLGEPRDAEPLGGGHRCLRFDRRTSVAGQDPGDRAAQLRGRRQRRGVARGTRGVVEQRPGVPDAARDQRGEPGSQELTGALPGRYGRGRGAGRHPARCRRCPARERVARHRGPQPARPLAAGSRMGVEPGRERDPLASAGGSRIAGPEERLRARIRLEPLGPAPLGAMASGGGERQPGILDEESGRKAVDPCPVARDQPRPVMVQEPVNGGPVLGATEGRECLRERAVGHEELAGPAGLRPRALLAGLRDEHRLEVAPEDLVIAERSLVIERDREDASALQLLEQRPAARPGQERVAEGPAQAAQDAGPDQEVAELVGQLRDDVSREVVAHEPGAGTEARQDPQPLVARLAARGEVEELQPRGPPLRPPGEACKLVRPERVVVEVAEQPLHLPRPKAQVVHADLQQRPGDPAPREVERGDSSRPGKDRERRRRVVDEAFEGSLRGRSRERVEVVHDQEEVRRRSGLEPGRGILDARPAPRQVRDREREGRFEACDQPRLAAVRALGAVPRHGMVGHRGPAGEERRLSRPRGGDDERQAMGPQLRQELVEALSRQPPDPGYAHLRRNDCATGVAVPRRSPLGPRSHPHDRRCRPPSPPDERRCETPLCRGRTRGSSPIPVGRVPAPGLSVGRSG